MYQSSYCDQVDAKLKDELINQQCFLVLIGSAAAHWDAAYFRNSNDGFKEKLDEANSWKRSAE
jgi:hypothetical protein